MREIVKRINLDNKGKAVGNTNNNLLIDTRAYKVEFDDSTTGISENLLAQVNEEGHCKMLLDEIIDHTQDVNAIVKEDSFTETTNGMKQRKMDTAG